MEKTLAELAEALGAELRGQPGKVITGVASLEAAKSTEIAFVAGGRYLEAARRSKAGALIVPPEVAAKVSHPALVVKNPHLAFARVLTIFAGRRPPPTGISPEAFIAEGAICGSDVSIYPQVYVGEGAQIGDRATLYPGVYVGANARIGADTTLHPNVTVADGCIIGARVTIHSGTVVGSDGFGYAQDGGRHVKIPQVGIVQIDDDVEIGANCCIDRATLGRTWIQRGVKIDNLVQVAHNVVVGEDSILVAQVGIAGSTKLGRNVVLAGQVGVAGHLEIGDGVQAAAQAGIAKSVPAGQAVGGSPAMDHRLWLRTSTVVTRLPEMHRQLRELERRLRALAEAMGAREGDERNRDGHQ